MKIAPILLAGAGLYLLTRKNESEQGPTIAPNGGTLDTTTGDTGPVDNNTQISGYNGNFNDLIKTVSYTEWKGIDWFNFVKELKEDGASSVEAVRMAFSLWNSPENPRYYIMPTFNSFLIGLSQIENNNLSRMRSADVAGLSSLGNLITWTSSPIYDTASNWWYGGPTPWSCADWKYWHQMLEQHYNNTQRANEIWEQAWGDPDNQCALIGSIGCPDTAYCRTDCDWIEYFASKGVSNLQSLMFGTYCDISNVALNTIGVLSDISEGIRNTSKHLKWAMPVLVGAASYYVYKKYYAKGKK